MTRVRFATVRALFESFPELPKQIGASATDESPVEYLKRLQAQGKLDDAVTFCAYLLPRREAVWWACGCVRALLDEIPVKQSEGLVAAETWVQHPDEDHRTAALAIAFKGHSDSPMTWLAFAAGWSGGSLVTNPELRAPVPPYMTARASRIAVLLGGLDTMKHGGQAERDSRVRSCIADGIKLAENGLG